MGGLARLAALLAFAAAAGTAAATERFVPTDPQFEVANVGRSMPDEEMRRKLAAWQADPTAESTAVVLASAYLARARATREPMFVGRAEAVLAPIAKQARATAVPRRLYAQTLQYRHDFAGAEQLLDEVLGQDPRDTGARALRASVRLVRGEFAAARGDCAQLVAAANAGAAIGFACLAEALAGGGQIERARTLLATLPIDAKAADTAARAYLLAVRGELAERALDLDGAIADYSTALSLAPAEDSTRAALADALAARGDVGDARELLDVERPSVALLVRQAQLAQGREREQLRARATAWIALESSRGDAVHNREAALLALDGGDVRAALASAQANFQVQRELADVRVLARAAVAARDERAKQGLRDWLTATGFRDALAEKMLHDPARG